MREAILCDMKKKLITGVILRVGGWAWAGMGGWVGG